MTWNLAALKDMPATPWRNGGGSTRELLAWPSPQDWQVRISVADVEQPGPFSAFAGVERWFAVLDGPGVELRFAGQARLLRAGVPLRFDGGAPPHCALPAGPTRDLNLMAPPGRGQMRRVVPGDRVRGTGRRLVALFAYESRATLLWDASEVELPVGTLAWRVHEGSGQGQVRSGAGWWMEVEL